MALIGNERTRKAVQAALQLCHKQGFEAVGHQCDLRTVPRSAVFVLEFWSGLQKTVKEGMASLRGKFAGRHGQIPTHNGVEAERLVRYLRHGVLTVFRPPGTPGQSAAEAAYE